MIIVSSVIVIWTIHRCCGLIGAVNASAVIGRLLKRTEIYRLHCSYLWSVWYMHCKTVCVAYHLIKIQAKQNACIPHLVRDAESFARIRIQRAGADTETDTFRSIFTSVTLFAIDFHAMFGYIRRVECLVTKCCKRRRSKRKGCDRCLPPNKHKKKQDEGQTTRHNIRFLLLTDLVLTSSQLPYCRTVRQCPSWANRRRCRIRHPSVHTYVRDIVCNIVRLDARNMSPNRASYCTLLDIRLESFTVAA